MPVILSKKKKKNLSVDVHPKAREAFEFFHSLHLRFDKVQLGLTSIESVSQTQIYRATHTPEDRIELISGFEYIGFSIHRFNLNDSLVIIENDLTPETISDISWSSVLRVLLSSVDTQSLESMREQLNLHAPPTLLRTFFNSDHLTQSTLSSIANVSVSGLKKQKKKTEKSSSLSQVKPAIFSAMKEQFDDE